MKKRRGDERGRKKCSRGFGKSWDLELERCKIECLGIFILYVVLLG